MQKKAYPDNITIRISAQYIFMPCWSLLCQCPDAQILTSFVLSWNRISKAEALIQWPTIIRFQPIKVEYWMALDIAELSAFSASANHFSGSDFRSDYANTYGVHPWLALGLFDNAFLQMTTVVTLRFVSAGHVGSRGIYADVHAEMPSIHTGYI